MVPALLKWIGNKQRFAETIISYMPEVFNDYYEPFLGSGAVLAQLLEADRSRMYPHFEHAYGSDILPYLVEIFQMVKAEPSKLSDYYEKEISKYYENPDECYLQIRDRFNADHNALDFCLLSRTCYSGVIRFRKADGYMSTPRGPHKPIAPSTFSKRLNIWSDLLENASFRCESFDMAMDRAKAGDVVYCDPPYTHSQGIIYGAQAFDIDMLWKKIRECKGRGVKVILSINGTRESKKKDISVIVPSDLFEREIYIDCGKSMIDRLQNSGHEMKNKEVHDKLCLTW